MFVFTEEAIQQLRAEMAVLAYPYGTIAGILDHLANLSTDDILDGCVEGNEQAVRSYMFFTGHTQGYFSAIDKVDAALNDSVNLISDVVKVMYYAFTLETVQSLIRIGDDWRTVKDLELVDAVCAAVAKSLDLYKEENFEDKDLAAVWLGTYLLFAGKHTTTLKYINQSNPHIKLLKDISDARIF